MSDTFVNEFGQEIIPGDKVVVVTHCTGDIFITQGVFVRMRGKSVQARVPDMSYEWFNKETGLTGSYYKIPSDVRGYRKKENRFRITTLQHNRIYKLDTK